MNSLSSDLFERYVELREIGAGGMARVVLARDCLLERQVALKLLRTSEPDLMQRLITEARLTALCRHENVVVIHEVNQQNGCPYIVLEYLSGRPLSALLESVWRLPYAHALGVLLPVLQALQHIHEMGVVHRDIKPDNIFLLDSGAAKLLDFGIAKLRPGFVAAGAATPQVTRKGMLVGTYEYMSPEQWHCSEIDHLTDIWACGILLHRMICGRHPLHPLIGTQLLTCGLLDQPMPSMLESAPSDVPRALVQVVDRCLHKRKSERWQSARELCAALEPFARGTHEVLDPAPRDSLGTAAATAAPRACAPTQLSNGDVAPYEPPHADAETFTHAPLVDISGPAVPARRRVAAERLTVAQGDDARTKLSIAFLAADPSGMNKSALDRQAHDIQAELERAGWRDHFALVTQWAPESLDLLRVLRKGPTVVHFAGSAEEATDRRWGHALMGDKKNGLYLRGHDGQPRLVPPSALGRTFGSAGRSVRVVVMSACYSSWHADALLAHVDCVVGMPACHPDAAKAFAIGFYGGLGERESLATAYDQGRAAVELEGHSSADIQIKVREGVNAEQLVLPDRPTWYRSTRG